MIKKVTTISLVGVLFATSGCTTIDPMTREVKTSNASVGAGLGAVGGALIGAMTGHSSKGVLLGAGIGALAGGVIGNSIDQEESMLRQQLDCTGVRVERCGDIIRLIMPCDITFANDSACIKSEFYDTLDSVSVVMRRFNHTLVKVAGFTSNTGSLMHNQLLSERRARCVADFLVDRGLNPSRIVTVGFGVRHPMASNDSEEGRAINRRVEITIRPLEID